MARQYCDRTPVLKEKSTAWEGTERQNSKPATEFVLNGEKYVIVPAIDGGADRQDMVGTMTVERRKYIIVPSDAKPNHVPEDGNHDVIYFLTRRELQIVMLVAEGKVDKQIADDLKISKWTVATHLRRIYSKLRVDSRAAMVYKCLQNMTKTERI